MNQFVLTEIKTIPSHRIDQSDNRELAAWLGLNPLDRRVNLFLRLLEDLGDGRKRFRGTVEFMGNTYRIECEKRKPDNELERYRKVIVINKI